MCDDEIKPLKGFNANIARSLTDAVNNSDLPKIYKQCEKHLVYIEKRAKNGYNFAHLRIETKHDFSKEIKNFFEDRGFFIVAISTSISVQFWITW